MKNERFDAAELATLEDYTPVRLQRARPSGWTAQRQSLFLSALSESGSIAQACHHAGITARSAYRLRADPRGWDFAAAWDQALRAATAKLLTLAYERAINGSPVEQWRNGKLVGETRQPSDKLLMFLLNHLAPYCQGTGTRWGRLEEMTRDAGIRLTGALETVADVEVPIEELGGSDYCAQFPLRDHEERLPPAFQGGA